MSVEIQFLFDNNEAKFHPEWATAIVGTREGGYYRGTNHGYEVRHEPKKSRTDPDGGTPGFIDFAVGDFNSPICAIEFKMAKSMDSKGYVFDYMKLLDRRNKIEKVISLSVVYERNTPIEPKDLNAILDKATTELKSHDCLSDDRPFRFIVIQIKGEEHHVWECSSEDHDMKFREIKQ